MEVRFIDDPADSNNGKIKVTMTGGKATSTYKLGIVGPDGSSVKAFPTAIDGTGLLLIQYVDIPTINAGAYLTGEYIFQATISDTLAGPDFNESKAYNWCPNTDKSLSINVIADCFSKSLIIQDLTSYPTGTLTRLITVDVPNVFNTDAVADQTSSEDEMVLSLIRSDGVAYYNVTYGVQVTASNVVSDTTDSDWDLGYQQGYTVYSNEVLIECGQDICSVISCVDTKVKELLDGACASGGIRNMAKQDADLLQEIQVSLAMYTYWLKCSNHTNTVYYYNRLKELTGNPSCLTVSGPTAIPDSTITYLRGRSAYEVWIDAGNTGSVEDFLDSLYPVGSWVNIASADFDADYSSDSTNPLRYRILKAHLEMLGEFVHGASEASGFKLLETTFDPADVETEAAFPIFNRTAGGIQVGQLYKDVDNAWKVRYSADYDSAQDQYVHGMIPLIGNRFDYW